MCWVWWVVLHLLPLGFVYFICICLLPLQLQFVVGVFPSPQFAEYYTESGIIGKEKGVKSQSVMLSHT